MMKSMMKKAIIVGCKGQDGTFLFEFLSNKNYNVIGIDIDVTQSNQNESLIKKKINILSTKDVNQLILSVKPDEIYYLAAYHQSAQDNAGQLDNLIKKSFDVNVNGLVNFLEALRQYSITTRLFYASSSLIFGNPKQIPQTEETPINPTCVYGITKVTGMQICQFYCEKYSIFSGIGILYNHESHLRTENFISQKIISAAKRIKAGLQKELIVGNLNAQTDWGYAPDYVEAMWKTMQIDDPETFIIASGKNHSVLDWVKLTFEKVGLNWTDYVYEDKFLITRKKGILIGDSSKLRQYTGWKPKTSFDDMVSFMLQG